jgi:hypothetical protein
LWPTFSSRFVNPIWFAHPLTRLQLCYTLLSLAFGLPFGRRFGRAGFLVFWMLNYLNMLAWYV